MKQRGLCITAANRVTACPKPLEELANDSHNLGHEKTNLGKHGISESISSDLGDDDRSMNSFDGSADHFSVDPQTPKRDGDELQSETLLISPITNFYNGTWVSPASNLNSNYDSLSQSQYDEFACQAQALSSHEVAIEDTLTGILSEIMGNSNIEDAQNSSGSMSQSDSENSEDDHSALSLALRNWCDQSGTSRDHMTSLLQVLRQFGHDKFPLDWRTQLKRCSEIDALNGMGSNFGDVSNVNVVLVCGACFLHTFSKERLNLRLHVRIAMSRSSSAAG